jgi:hypothetical protein
MTVATVQVGAPFFRLQNSGELVECIKVATGQLVVVASDAQIR